VTDPLVGRVHDGRVFNLIEAMSKGRDLHNGDSWCKGRRGIGSDTRKSFVGLEMCLNDLRQDGSHSLVARFKIMNSLFNSRNKRFLAVSCHLGVHTIAFSTVDRSGAVTRNDDEMRTCSPMGKLITTTINDGSVEREQSTYRRDSSCSRVSFF
jgi:hypothetical protein